MLVKLLMPVEVKWKDTKYGSDREIMCFNIGKKLQGNRGGQEIMHDRDRRT